MKYLQLKNGSRVRLPKNGGAALEKYLRKRGMVADKEKAPAPEKRPAPAKKEHPVAQVQVEAQTSPTPAAAKPRGRPRKVSTANAE